jgi:hypothetical protein
LHDDVTSRAKAKQKRVSAAKEAVRARGENVTGLVTLQMAFEGTGLKGGLDILSVSRQKTTSELREYLVSARISQTSGAPLDP